LPAASSW